ncbi:MAG: DUF488 domain-containing protein [Chloroflexi bacterium]|nr:DUF488 domain-containing protein [Chloroflexota bacterium]
MDGPAGHHPRQLAAKPTVYTVGHSTRPFEELAALLKERDVAVLCDTRSYPRSRRNPQFNIEELGPALEDCDIEYQHQPLLGGRRQALPDSPNGAWQNAAFRGYADYMQTAGFERGMQALEALARERVCAVMCAELVWWRCHRRLIADRLTVDGFEVLHLMNLGQPPQAHRRSPGLVVADGGLVYPPPQAALPLGG